MPVSEAESDLSRCTLDTADRGFPFGIATTLMYLLTSESSQAVSGNEQRFVLMGSASIEWIGIVAQDVRDDIVRMVAQAVRQYGGLNDPAKLDIRTKFDLSPQKVDQAICWVCSLPQEDTRMSDPQPGTSGTQNELEIPPNPALGASRGAYSADVEPYKHHALNLSPLTVTMGEPNPTTLHMESKKGSSPDKVDKDGAV